MLYENENLKSYNKRVTIENTKVLREAVMKRSRLKNVYLKHQDTTNWNN